VSTQFYLNHLKHGVYNQDFSDDVSVTTNSPVILGMTKIDDIEMVTRDVMYEFDDMNAEAASISSPISTEMLDNNHPLCEMDAKSESSNQNSIIHNINHQHIPCNQVKLTPNGVRFQQYELGKAKLYCNTALEAVEHDKKVKAEMPSIFQTPRYQS
jgi:hypothetical protein